MLLDIFLFQFVSRLASQDDELAHDVLSAQVDARVRFGVSFLLCQAYGLAEGDVGTDFIEDIVQRSAQHSFDFQNLVAAVDEVVDGVDDGQSGSHVGLKQEFDPSPACRLLEFPVILEGGRGCDLVGSHHRDVVGEEVLVERCHLGACRAVHEDGVEDVHADDLVVEAFDGAGRAVFQLFPVGGKVDARP